MFLDEASDLVRRGIRSAYVAVESEEKYVRGKIDFSREARKGAARAHMTKPSCTTSFCPTGRRTG